MRRIYSLDVWYKILSLANLYLVNILWTIMGCYLGKNPFRTMCIREPLSSSANGPKEHSINFPVSSVQALQADPSNLYVWMIHQHTYDGLQGWSRCSAVDWRHCGKLKSFRSSLFSFSISFSGRSSWLWLPLSGFCSKFEFSCVSWLTSSWGISTAWSQMCHLNTNQDILKRFPKNLLAGISFC